MDHRLLALICSAACAGEPSWTGYRGPLGQGIYPGASPPAQPAVLWQAPLANWGNSSPVAVASTVFAVSEPGWKHDFPVLQCFDTTNGRMLWERELDHLPHEGLPQAEEQRVRALWHDVLAWYRGAYGAKFLWNSGQKDEARATWATLGISPPTKDGPLTGYLFRSVKPAKTCLPATAQKDLAKFGLVYECWGQGLSLGNGVLNVGHAYPTPVSDGRRLYLATAFGASWCFDLDGTLVWCKRVPGLDTSDFCSRAKSPLLFGNLFISDLDGVVRALDRATGAVRWTASRSKTYETIVSPVVIRVGDKDVLLCGGADEVGGVPALHAYSLPDGAELNVVGWTSCGGTMLVDPNHADTVFFTGGGEHGGWDKKGAGAHPPVAAVRFSQTGSNLTSNVLWSGVGTGGHGGLVCHGDKLYANGLVIDTTAGKVVAGTMAGKRIGQAACPPVSHLLAIAGGHVFGVDRTPGRNAEARGQLLVYTLDGKKAGEVALPKVEVKDEKLQQVIGQTGDDGWWFSYSCGFTIAGSRLYVRSNDELICLGK